MHMYSYWILNVNLLSICEFGFLSGYFLLIIPLLSFCCSNFFLIISQVRNVLIVALQMPSGSFYLNGSFRFIFLLNGILF
jgi:hypothetical protein